MLKPNITQKNYTINKSIRQLKLPIDVDVIIPENDSVRLLSNVLEELDYSGLMQEYSHLGRKPKPHPTVMFKIVVYASANGIYESRNIEKACLRDINFRWLLDGEKAPDHNTINRFITKKLSKHLEDLFFQFVEKLCTLDEIEFENIFIDGTKIEANANKYTFVWRKSIEKYEKKLIPKIIEFINELNVCYETEFKNTEIDIDTIDKINDYLNNRKEVSNIKFKYGKGVRKTRLQKQIELMNSYTERYKKYQKYNSLFEGRNSFSKTDTDATFMRMKDDHMKNSQLKPGYNIQIGVEGEYIVGVDISSERSDKLTLVPFLDKLKNNLSKKYSNIVADSGYESEENYMYLEKNAQKAFIKPQIFKKMKTKKFKKDISKRENMEYNTKQNFYICKNNKKLYFKSHYFRKSKSGYKSKISVYECESCKNCMIKKDCTKSKNNRQLHVATKFIEKRENSLRNITSKEGITLRINRSIQAEGAFGVIKEDYGFRRFLTRGKNKVLTEFLVISLGYNINKLHKKIQNNRLGTSLFEKKAA